MPRFNLWGREWIRQRNNGLKPYVATPFEDGADHRSNQSQTQGQTLDSARFTDSEDYDHIDSLFAEDFPRAKYLKRAPITNRGQVRAAVRQLTSMLTGSEDIREGAEDDEQPAKFSALAWTSGEELERLSCLVAQCKPPLDQANRERNFKKGLSDDAKLNKQRMQKTSLVWLPKRFPASDIEETDLYCCPSLFGRMGEKLYLHYVLVRQDNNMMVILLQRRNGQGISGSLPERTKCDYVRIQTAGTEDKREEGGLPCLFLEGRRVPQGLTLLLRPFWVEYGNCMCPTKGDFVQNSKSLIHLYVSASVAEHLDAYDEHAKITELDIVIARALVSEEVGDLKEFFAARGRMPATGHQDSDQMSIASGPNSRALPYNRVHNRVHDEYVDAGPGHTGITSLVRGANVHEDRADREPMSEAAAQTIESYGEAQAGGEAGEEGKVSDDGLAGMPPPPLRGTPPHESRKRGSQAAQPAEGTDEPVKRTRTESPSGETSDYVAGASDGVAQSSSIVDDGDSYGLA